MQPHAVDLDELTVTNGRIDIAQVRALQEPLTAIQQRIASLQTKVADIDSPWLIAPVEDRIDELAIDLASQRQRSDDALTVALAAPGLFGGDGPRTYFIGFTTPAEARGSGGFMGNWAGSEKGPGQWVTVYANEGHMYMMVAGIRFDTSGAKQDGSRWHAKPRPTSGYVVSHPEGL